MSRTLAATLAAAAALAAPARARAEETATSTSGRDFAREVQLLYRVVACAGDAELPPSLDAAIVDDHCQKMRPILERYRRRYVDGAKLVIAAIRPEGVPDRVVYPFSGGDILTALTTYPDAKEYTTLSLEQVGDPRTILTIKPDRLKASLDLIRGLGGGLLIFNDNKTESLSKLQKTDLPGHLSLFMLGLAAHGATPQGLRYFRLEKDGSVRYLDEDRKISFANAELRFTAADGTSRVHRHFAENLADSVFGKDTALQAHLQAKGKIAAMTKAASYLLWRSAFSRIRGYLLENMLYMVSDSTGIPPRFSEPAGFVVETYGHYDHSFLGTQADIDKEMRETWDKQPERLLPFRYGYLAKNGRYHMMITRRPELVPPPPKGSGPIPREDTTPRLDLQDVVAGGDHWRLMTKEGPVHVWRPKEYDAKTAGVIVYAHGYYDRVDYIWREHRLADQFAAMKKNALFVVPLAASGDDEEPYWKSFKLLFAEVKRLGKIEVPKGPIALIAHSGGFRSALVWLTDPRLQDMVLLDALYNGDKDFAKWLKQRGKRMVLVGEGTMDRCEVFAKRWKPEEVARRDEIAAKVELEPSEAKAKLILLRSQYPHMEIVTEGRVIPAIAGLVRIAGPKESH